MTAASIRNIIYDFDLDSFDSPERKYGAFEEHCKNSPYGYELRKSELSGDLKDLKDKNTKNGRLPESG